MTEQFAPVLKESMVDIIVGIACKEPRSIGPVMTLFDVPKERHAVIKALIHLFNKNNSMLSVSTEAVEKYIQNNLGKVKITPGVV